MMLDLVSVLGGTVRSEDLPDVFGEFWFARAAAADEVAGTTRGLFARALRRTLMFCGLCALLGGSALLRSRA